MLLCTNGNENDAGIITHNIRAYFGYVVHKYYKAIRKTIELRTMEIVLTFWTQSMKSRTARNAKENASRFSYSILYFKTNST